MPEEREAELLLEALGGWCLLRSSLCHSRVTEGADLGKNGSLKLQETGVEKLS
jgi:hypothetical protein